MGVRLEIGDLIYEAADYAVQENATPLAASDSSGDVGTIDFSIPRPDPDMKVAVQTPLLVEDPDNPGFLMEVTP